MNRLVNDWATSLLFAGVVVLGPTWASAEEICGDGIFASLTEDCDDGNTEAGDGCSPDCRVECTEVGEGATEHTCLHGSLGPFASRVANAEGEPVTADVSPSHTYFTITLPGEPGENQSRVRFQPASDQPYAIYLKKPYPLRLLDEEGQEPELLLEHAISSCAVADSLTWVRVFAALDPEQTYTVELGPYEETTMSLAFEALGFVGPLYRDADLDGHSDRGREVAMTWCAPPPGYSYEQGGDCDDADPSTFPGAPELCDGINSDCDGRMDEEENALCAESELGAVCATFKETVRCGCERNDDCPPELKCDAAGRCTSPTSGTGGQGGAASGDSGSGGITSPGDAGAPSGSEPSGGRSGGGGKTFGNAGSGGNMGSPDDNGDDEDGVASGSGCSCSVPSNRPTSPGWLVFAAPVLMFARGRARRRPQRERRPPFAALLTLLSALGWSGQARAELPPDCGGLGRSLTEHSCFHSTLGPFEFREATPGDTATEDTPNVDPVHTEYRVLLTPEKSSLTYRPARGGSFTVFTGFDIPLTIHREGEGAKPVLYRTTETDCEALPLARVYDLGGQLTYTLTFESETASDVALVIEFVDDFLIHNGIDRDGDGYGDPSETVRSVCIPPTGFVQNTSDCDDSDPTVHPGALELCGDAVDQNCNGLPDDAALGCRTGVGVCATQGISACGDDGQVMCIAEGSSPSEEVCNGKDDDCDGLIDEESALCADENRPRCVRFGFSAKCGCQFDSDCGGGESGLRACDQAIGECVLGETATGGAPSTGGEGGEASEGEASGGKPGSGGDKPSGGAGGEKTGSGSGDSKTPNDAGGPGCSCNTSAPFPSSPDLSVLLFGSLLFWQSRRKRVRNTSIAPERLS